MRKHGKRDGNHAEIVKACRDAGMTVLDLGAMGGGCPDTVIGWRGLNFLVEIKDGSLPPSARKLTQDQVNFIDTWAGTVIVATSAEDAITQITQFFARMSQEGYQHPIVGRAISPEPPSLQPSSVEPCGAAV